MGSENRQVSVVEENGRKVALNEIRETEIIENIEKKLTHVDVIIVTIFVETNVSIIQRFGVY